MMQSLTTRNTLAKNLDKDPYFIASNLSLKLCRISLYFNHVYADVKLTINSYYINRTFTTQKLIKKWKIVNGFKGITSIFVSFSAVATLIVIGVSYQYVPIETNTINVIYNVFLSTIIPIFRIGRTILILILYLFVCLASHSLELYNEIMVKENTNWKKPGLFLNYFISCGFKNFNKLAKIKTQKLKILIILKKYLHRNNL